MYDCQNSSVVDIFEIRDGKMWMSLVTCRCVVAVVVVVGNAESVEQIQRLTSRMLYHSQRDISNFEDVVFLWMEREHRDGFLMYKQI